MVENSITLDKISHIDCTIQLGNTVEPSYKEPFYKELVLESCSHIRNYNSTVSPGLGIEVRNRKFPYK